MVAAIVGADQFQIGHVGDSRAYLLRQGTLHQLTQDHSWAQEAIAAGRLTPEAARVHPNRHVIKRYLGGGPDVEIDYRNLDVATGAGSARAGGRPTQTERQELLPGDTLLLCTDGLSDVVEESEIKALLVHNAPQAAADKLVAAANRAGGPDNITVLVARNAGGNAPMAGAAPARGRMAAVVGAGALLVALLAGGALWMRSNQAAAGVAAAESSGAIQVAAALPAAAAGTPTEVADEPAAVEAVATPTAAATIAATTALVSATSQTATATPTESPPASSTLPETPPAAAPHAISQTPPLGTPFFWRSCITLSRGRCAWTASPSSSSSVPRRIWSMLVDGVASPERGWYG